MLNEHLFRKKKNTKKYSNSIYDENINNGPFHCRQMECTKSYLRHSHTSFQGRSEALKAGGGVTKWVNSISAEDEFRRNEFFTENQLE
jgi:hypothetical protein